MANVGPTLQTRPGVRKWSLDTTETIHLGVPSEMTVGQWAIQMVPTGLTGGIVPKQRVVGSGLSGGNLQNCVYYESDGETAIAAGTQSDAAGVYYVPSDGVDTYLTCTLTAGSMDLYVWPLRG